MFIQVIRGRVKDKSALRAALDKWESDLEPEASGFLGSTAGVADDGTAVAVVRFGSEDAARANGERAEQGAWWDETSKLYEGGVTFYDCPIVETTMGGGSDDAGFVQVMIYKPSDVEAIRKMAKEFESLGAMRPDIIGGTSAFATDGTVIDTNYFTSEAEARAGESQPMTDSVRELVGRFNAVAGEVEFIDLKDPWLHSA